MAARKGKRPLPPVVVLDSEALSALAAPKERGAAARRAQAVLEAVERRGGVARVPAPVLAEVSRSRRRAGVDRVLRGVRVVATDRAIAERAADLLEHARRSSADAIDAFVVATAMHVGPAVIITGDPADLTRLSSDSPGITIQRLP